MNSVNYKRLEKSLTDVIQEHRSKLATTTTRSRCIIPRNPWRVCSAHREEDADSTERALASLSAHTAGTLGAIEVTRDAKRFCFHISAEGTQYVHEQLPEPAFLRAFLQVMRGLTVSFDDILAVFHQFSDKVHCEKLEGNEEFDYLVYFEDGTPDSYRYCIKLDDDGDAVYHRFTPEDYAAFGF